MLHGLLILDKPVGLTSAQVVENVRRKLKQRQVGHTGTLDPMATGVLPMVLGNATKLAGYLIADDKGYDAELELGVETDTLDRDGRVLARNLEAADAVTDHALARALDELRQSTSQLPPMYSAIKQGGVRLYQHARAGQEVPRTPRPIALHRLELRWRRGRTVALSVLCSKGTFVRSLVDDLGRMLGVGAHLTQLRRTQSGGLTLAQALPLAELTPEQAAERLIPLAGMLPVPSIPVPDERLIDLRNGRRDLLDELTLDLAGMGQLVDARGALLAVVERTAEGSRYLRVFAESLPPQGAQPGHPQPAKA